MNSTIENVLAELRRRLQELYGARLAALVLFGSQTRGDAECGSDIDLLVVLNGEVTPMEEIDRTIDDVADVSLHNNVVVSCVFVSRESFEREQSPLLINVRREGVAL